jgi:bifunctional DNA-binding transcriptional regulator/antitoxin component of YhaV-PrlF toxin-antitoxin module
MSVNTLERRLKETRIGDTLSAVDVRKKRISVSKKRQITIPADFFKKLNISGELECIMPSNSTMLIIRPVPKDTEFAEEILADLLRQGYKDQELLEQFKKTRAQIRPAVEKMLEEARLIASKLEGSGDEQLKDIFSDLED